MGGSTVVHFGFPPRDGARLVGKGQAFPGIVGRYLGSASGMAIAIALLSAPGGSSAHAQTFDRFVIVQPIRVCDDAGNNCATVNYMQAGTAKALGQAGVLPIFLPTTQFNSTALLNSNNGPSDFDQGNGGSANASTVNMWFTGLSSIVNCGGTTAVGCATTPGREVVIDSQALLNEAAGNGGDPYHRTIAHELGHSFGLDHVTGAGTAGNLLEVPNTVDRTGYYDEIGVDRFLLTDDQIDAIRGNSEGTVQTASNCNGGGGPNLLTVATGSACLNVNGFGGNDTITLQAGSGVLVNVAGGAGDDTIDILAGSIVGNNVDGGANNDTIRVAGVVLNNVVGGTGNDNIHIQTGAQVVRGVDAGVGTDTILIEGAVAADPLPPFPATGTLPVATVPSPTTVLGGRGDDQITIRAGANIAGSVFGDDNDGNQGNDGADTIRVEGGQIAGDVNGEGGADTIIITGGDIARFAGLLPGSPVAGGNVRGGGGSDWIEMTGGRVANNIEGEDGNDTIRLSGGALGGSVLAGAGIDLIRISGTASITGGVDAAAGDDGILITGGVIAGSVNAGIGNDIVQMTGGTVGQDIDAGEGNDNVTLQGGAVLGGIVTGAGVDFVSLYGGTVGGNVHTGIGNDWVELTVTNVGGAIISAEGDDRVRVLGGRVTSILTGADNDTMLYTGGVIASAIDMGGGTDTLDVYGTGAGSTASQAGLIVDGGDDASSADGSVDIVNLRGVREVLGDLRNWEFINLINNSAGDLGVASRTITTEQLLIDASSSLIASGNGGVPEIYTIQGNVVNAGVLDMLDNTPSYDEFRVTGTYNGLVNSLFGIDAFLGAAGSPADLMRVGTATAGQTAIVVNDTNAGPGVFNPVGIEVVRVEGAPGSTEKDDFTLLGGPIQKDLWVFDLGLDNTRSLATRTNADVHVLYSRPSDIVQFSPYFATGALTAFHTSLDPWVDRQQQLADTLEAKGMVAASFKDEPAAFQPKTYIDVWASAYGSRRFEEGVSKLTFFGDSFTSVMDYDQSTYGFQGGVDMISIMENGGAVMAGVFGGFLDSSMRPDQIAVTGDYSGGSVGVYMAYVKAGFTLSAVGKGDFLNFDWKAPTLDLEASSDVNTFGGRIEAAYKHGVTRSAWVEPYASITYAKSNWDRFSVLATTFDLDDNESVLGRLGFRIGADFRHSETLFSKVFAGIGVIQEFDEKNTANIVSGGFNLPLTHEVDETSLELQAGVKLEDASSGLGLSITSSGRFSEDVEEYGAKAVINYKF